MSSPSDKKLACVSLMSRSLVHLTHDAQDNCPEIPDSVLLCTHDFL